MVATVLAYRKSFQPQDTESVPPVAINLLTRQANLIRLHLWRLVGIVFLVLLMRGQMPALWALPAGIGDILVAVTALLARATLEEDGVRFHFRLSN